MEGGVSWQWYMERGRQSMREWFIEQRMLVGREQVNGQPINDKSCLTDNWHVV